MTIVLLKPMGLKEQSHSMNECKQPNCGASDSCIIDFPISIAGIFTFRQSGRSQTKVATRPKIESKAVVGKIDLRCGTRLGCICLVGSVSSF